jgi:hypothetical protein
MQTSQQELSEAYRTFSDAEIASLHAQVDSLTEDARVALTSEIERRGIDSAKLSKLYTMHLRQEAKFDRRQKDHRKKVVSYLLGGDPYWTIAIILALLAAAALFAFFESHR